MTYALASLMSVSALLFVVSPLQDRRQTVTAIVANIQRADYEGDRTALKRLHAELTPFVDDRQVASRVLYWRGFALWRRALNGFNDAADRTQIGEDLTQAVIDFQAAVARDPAFVDARIGAASCLVNDSFLNMKSNPARARELLYSPRRFSRRRRPPHRITHGCYGCRARTSGIRRRNAVAVRTWRWPHTRRDSSSRAARRGGSPTPWSQHGASQSF